MFGYLVANKPELRVREFDKYREYYCGVCQSLRCAGGPVAQMTLSYDMTFVALILTGLYEPETKNKTVKCVAHMGKKMAYLQNPYFDYAADMNMLLTYYKCIDDWHDERSKKSRGMQLMLQRDYERLREKYPDKVKKLAGCMKRIWKLESEKGPVDEMRLDDLCVASGELLECVLVPHKDVWEPELRQLGFNLGKYIYLLDAYDDLEKDKEKGVFNPLFDLEKKADFHEWIKRMLLVTAADATAAFERLPIIQDAEIMRNILYAGIWSKYPKKCTKDKIENE